MNVTIRTYRTGGVPRSEKSSVRGGIEVSSRDRRRSGRVTLRRGYPGNIGTREEGTRSGRVGN